jgi:AcrR family transcriptional regulator
MEITPDPQARLDRRTRRKNETRRRLLTAGRRLISSDSVDALRIRDLAEEADLSHGSFYNHFESKEDFVDAVVRETLTDLAEMVLSDIPQDTDWAIKASEADRRFLLLARHDPDFARLLINLNHREDVFTRAVLPYARATLQPGIADGRFTIPNLDAFLITLTSSALGMIRAILDGDAPPRPDSLHAELLLRMTGIPHTEAAEISRRPLTRRRS